MLLGRQKTCKVYDGGGSDRDDNRDNGLKREGPPAGDQGDLIQVSGWRYPS